MIKISVVIPCLNEEKTIGKCIEEAFQGIEETTYNGEVIVSDNGSDDSSVIIAKKSGARVVETNIKGYGSAIINGINNANGEFVIVGDADLTYNFLDIPNFIKKLEKNNDIVIGNRFMGGIEKGAMPFLNKHIGNPFLSLIARLFFKINIGDFHCGLRGIKKSVYDNLNLKSLGMEFATEMIVKASLLGYKISEVPTILRKPPYDRTPHLKPFRDGFRHLYLIFSHSLVNEKNLLTKSISYIFGLLYFVLLIFSPIQIANIEFSSLTLLLFNLLFLISLIFLKFKVLIKNLLLNQTSTHKSTNLLFILVVLLLNSVLVIFLFYFWYLEGFGNLNQTTNVKIFSVIFSSTVYVLAAFFVEMIYTASNFFVND